MKNLFFTTLVLAAAAHAEVKPDGTILESYCGQATRTHRVCLATVQGSKDLYIVKETFTVAPNDGFTGSNLTYARVTTVEQINAVGATTTHYTGYAVGPDDFNGRYLVQKEVSLTTTQVVRPGLPLRGKYLENNSVFAEDFVLQPMVTSLSE